MHRLVIWALEGLPATFVLITIAFAIAKVYTG